MLGWLGLVPWLAVLDRAASPSAALGAAVGMAVAFELAVFGWFAGAIAGYTGASRPLALAGLVLAAPLLQPQLLVFALARQRVQSRGARACETALVGACTYVGTEWLVPKLFADTLGWGLYPSRWMRQAADLAGLGGLTFVLLLGNECALAGVRAIGRAEARRAVAAAAGLATLVLALLGYGALRCAALDARGAGRPVTVGMVQANIGHYDRLAAERGKYATVRMVLDTHFALSTDLLARGGVDLLVWPETVYPTTFGTPKSADGAAFDREIARFVTHAGVPLVFGAYDADGGDEFNAAVFLTPSPGGSLGFDTYRKASLFPLTERVPGVLESAVVRGWLPWLGTWKPGPGPRIVPVRLPDGRMLRTVPLICYDAIEPGYARAGVRAGGDVIVTLSNDSWFAEGAGPRLHLVGAAFRAIETRRPELRATNTGISAVITSTGDVIATAGVGQRTTLVAAVTPVEDVWTLVLAWGDWLGPSALAAGALLFTVGARARMRRSSG